MFTTIIKRDGRAVPYEKEKIALAIDKAMQACGRHDYQKSLGLADLV